MATWALVIMIGALVVIMAVIASTAVRIAARDAELQQTLATLISLRREPSDNDQSRRHAIIDQMAIECSTRDKTIETLRAELRALYDRIGDIRDPGARVAPTVLDAAMEDLDTLSEYIYPGNEMPEGESHAICRGCGLPIHTPHRWENCARLLRSRVGHGG